MPSVFSPLSWRRGITVASVLAVVMLSGCDYLGIESATQTDAKKEAEGKAIGAACRQAVRSIEDCYRSNTKANKAAVYDGWLQMDGYMRDNKLDGMPAAAADNAVPANQAIGKSEEIVPAAGGDKKASDTKDSGKSDKH